MSRQPQPWDLATLCLHTGHELDPATGAAAVPIYQTSTFHQPGLDEPGPYDYARSGNPTRAALEGALAALEGAAGAFAFASGMAAIASLFLTLGAGDHVVVTADCYGGTYRLLTRVLARWGLAVTFTDTCDPEAVVAAIRPNTRAIWVESLSNPFLQVADLPALAELARSRGVRLWVDNTFLSPALCRPLALGADAVVHSATKYLGGHSDLVAGTVAVRDREAAAAVAFVQNAVGAVLGPQDCFLLMRGLKTLPLRVQRQQATALAVAQWLRDHPLVAAVYYPGLPDHPGYELARALGGFGAVLSFRLVDGRLTRPFLRALRLPLLGVSLGAVESIITVPAYHSHASLPPAERERRGIDDSLLRLSVGLEAPEDLIADLAQALAAAERAVSAGAGPVTRRGPSG
ncbi:MAG: PLP-dependent aspartate aminotransferase family protein [Firmicutes bacterium]|nr:PLP-dependent aspartate aminotransferase family protein [Bacillota bacterium]